MIKIGVKENKAVYASPYLIDKHGIREVQRMLGVNVRTFPIKLDLLGNYVNVEADTWQEAVEIAYKYKRN